MWGGVAALDVYRPAGSLHPLAAGEIACSEREREGGGRGGRDHCTEARSEGDTSGATETPEQEKYQSEGDTKDT